MGQVSVKFLLPYKGFYSVFVNVLFYWSLETENVDPLFLNVMFVKMISEVQGGFQQFLYLKIKIWLLRFQSQDKWTLTLKR